MAQIPDSFNMHSLTRPAQPFRPEPLEITGGDLRELQLMNVSRRRAATFDLALLFHNWDYVDEEQRLRIPRLIRSKNGELVLQVPERNGLELSQDTLEGLALRRNQPERGVETGQLDFSEYRGWGGTLDLALRWSRLMTARSLTESRRDYAGSTEELEIITERAEEIAAKTRRFIEEIRNRIRYFSNRAENLFRLNAFAAAAKDAAFCIKLLRFLDANDDSGESGCEVRGFLLSEVALHARAKAWMHYSAGNPSKATRALREGLDELQAIQPLRSFENDDVYCACEEVLKETELEFRAARLSIKHRGEERRTAQTEHSWKVEQGIDLQDIVDQWSEADRRKGYRRIEGSHGRPVIQKMMGRGMLEIEQDHCWNIFKPQRSPGYLDFPELPEDHLLVWCKEACTTPVGFILEEKWTRRLLTSVNFFAERSALLERLAFDAFEEGRIRDAQSDWRRVIRDCDVSRNTLNLILEYSDDVDLVHEAKLLLPRFEKQSAIALAGNSLAVGNAEKFVDYLHKKWSGLREKQLEETLTRSDERSHFEGNEQGKTRRTALIKEFSRAIEEIEEDGAKLQALVPEALRIEIDLVKEIRKAEIFEPERINTLYRLLEDVRTQP